MAGQDHPVSPLALPLPELPPIPGARVGTAQAGIRYKAREDVTMMAFPAGTTVAGVFTKNRCPGAPVDWCRDRAEGRQGPRPGRHCRQFERLHRQGGPRDLRARPRRPWRSWWAASRARSSSPPPA